MTPPKRSECVSARSLSRAKPRPSGKSEDELLAQKLVEQVFKSGTGSSSVYLEIATDPQVLFVGCCLKAARTSLWFSLISTLPSSS